MLISKPTVVVLLSRLSLSLASAILQDRQNGVTCQTSDGSPTTADVTSVINQVRGQGGDCKNTNGAGSGKLRRIMDDRWSLNDHFS